MLTNTPEQTPENSERETLRRRAKRLAITTEAGRLIDEILETHHNFLEENLSPTLQSIKSLAETTHYASAEKALGGVLAMSRVQLEIALHLIKEEMCLFPHILDLCEPNAELDTPTIAKRLCEGPIRQLEEDHCKIKALLAQISLVLMDSEVKIASDIVAWNTARYHFHRLLQDIERHTHLEDNRLVPLIRAHVAATDCEW